MTAFGIADAADHVGVATHVLRHWEDVGLLSPARTPGGHRQYGENDVARAIVVRRAQRTGMSLEEIRVILAEDRQSRAAVVERHLRRLQAQIDESRAAIAFLDHTRSCAHRLIASCPECADFAAPVGSMSESALDAPLQRPRAPRAGTAVRGHGAAELRRRDD